MLLLPPLAGLFVAADLLRDSSSRTSTILTMIAWSLFLVYALAWAWRGTSWREALRELGAVALLTLIAGLVLLLYYVRSHTLEAGVHVDSAYTLHGITWFTELRNPITFVGGNPSYHQFPMMLFGHLPALAVGFRRLGAFSAPFGTMLQIALLLAVMTKLFVPRRIAAQALTAGLLAAVFSNRMLVLSYNDFGYTIPAICLGLMFLAAVDDESTADPDRVVGGLLSFSLLHHYSGFTQVLPITLIWLTLGPRSLRRLPSFLAKNSLLLVVLGIFLITLTIQPELVVRRIRHVAVGVGQPVVWLDKLRNNWSYLTSAFPGNWFRLFFVESPGTWALLNIPPLAGPVVPALVGSWILSAWTLPGRRLRYALHLGVFSAAMFAVAGLQHLLTDFGDYRDLTLIFSLLTTGLLFVLRGARLGPRLQWLVLASAFAIAGFNYVDLGNLHGRIHGSGDYARLSQSTMEGLTRFLQLDGPQRLGVARIHVVLDSVFPLQGFYMSDLQRYAIPIEVVDANSFCADPEAIVESASSVGCESFLLVTDTRRCAGRVSGDGKSGPRVAGYVYSSICGDDAARWTKRSRVAIAVDPEDPKGGWEHELRRVVIGCDNAAEVMVNGERVGVVEAWEAPATFALPLGTERVVVAVKARNDGGPGGLVGALIDPDSFPVPRPARWVCSVEEQNDWYLPAFDDRAWTKPKVLAPHGSPPWGIVDAALGGADWVWTENPAREQQTIYCRWWIAASSSGSQ
jgi:hypothetical protein